MSSLPPEIYLDSGIPHLIMYVVTGLSVLAVVVTLWLVVLAWRAHKPAYLYVIGAFWAIFPPIWFWCEYEFLYRNYGNAGAFEFFKYGQQVTVAIWAGMTLFLFAVSQSDHFKAR